MKITNAFVLRTVVAIVLLVAIQNVSSQTNKYKDAGFELLDQLNTRFYNASTGLYVEEITTANNLKSGPAFLWPAGHMIRALLWGAMIDSKYDARLYAYTNKMSWDTNGQGYGCIQNGERFFDDNGLIGDVIMDVYLHKFRSALVLNKGLFALNYCLKYRDAQWGIPQTESGLNKGIFYMGPVDPLANAYAKYFTITGDSAHLDIAKTYYDKFNDYTLKLKDPVTLLFLSGSTYANGVWTKPNEGPRACNTAAVVLLGIRLYKITGDERYLNEARAMADAILKRYYTYNAGFGEISYWGGNYSVEMLCEMYEIDRDLKWYYAAKNICDFLIDKSRDKAGYYPDGASGSGNWNVVRTNDAPNEKVGMMSQACAANALLRFAYVDLDMPLSKGVYRITNQANGKVVSQLSSENANGGRYVALSTDEKLKSQKWLLSVDHSGKYTIISVENSASVSVENCEYNNAARIETNTLAGGDCVKFSIEKADDGFYKILHKSGKALAFDATANDALVLADPTETELQKWKVERLEPKAEWLSPTADTTVFTSKSTVLKMNAVSDADDMQKVEYYVNGVLTGISTVAPFQYNWSQKTTGIYALFARAYDKSGNTGYSTTIKVKVLAVDEGVYSIANVGNKKNLSIISDNANADGALAVTSNYESRTDQHWVLQTDAQGFYSFAPLSSEFKIAPADCKRDNGTQIKQYSVDPVECRQFSMSDVGLGQFQIIYKSSNKALMAAPNNANDIPVYLWDKSINNYQKWKFTAFTTNNEDIQSDDLIKVYPNPVKSVLNIDSKYHDTTKEIFTTTGRTLLKTKDNQIDMSAYSPGLYVLLVRSGAVVNRVKFIKE